MAANRPLTPEEAVDMSRRVVGRRVSMRVLRDILSYCNLLWQSMGACCFNAIHRSAPNLREPTLWRHIRLFLGTRSLLWILRGNFRQNRVSLTADWGRAVIGRISLSLKELGSVPLYFKPRDLAKRLDRVGKMISRMTGYEYYPSLLTERVLLPTYRYIFMVPHDRRFSALHPSGICRMLRQNGVPPENLYYQNHKSLPQGKETATYEFASGGKRQQYLHPPEHVELDIDPEGYGMLPACRPDGSKGPLVSQGAEEAALLFEKTEKNGRSIVREKKTVQSIKAKDTKAKSKGMRM